MEPLRKIESASSLPRDIWIIGFVSFLINFSSIIIFTLSPSYLVSVLGVTTFSIGILQGTVDFIAWVIRMFSGVISDYCRKRKPILLFSSALIVLSRPLFMMSSSFMGFFLAKSLDRLGNGLHAAPREALVGDIASLHGSKGACYGLRQSLSTAGSFTGALIMITFFHSCDNRYFTFFLIATISPVIAFMILIWKVKEVPFSSSTPQEKLVFKVIHLKKLPATYWSVVMMASLFMLSNYSGAFILLHSEAIAQTQIIAPLVMIVQNMATTAVAYPMGYLSDKIGHTWILGLGFLVTALSGIVFAFSSTSLYILFGAFLWGIQVGMTQSLFMTRIAETTHTDIRGSAFGIYYALMGIMLFLSNSAIGYIAHHFSLSMGFLTSACIALFALCCLFLMNAWRKAGA
jgi:MFS family permease